MLFVLYVDEMVERRTESLMDYVVVLHVREVTKYTIIKGLSV